MRLFTLTLLLLAAPAFARGPQAAPPAPPGPPSASVAPLPPLPDDPPPGVQEWSQQREREILEVVREHAPEKYAELMYLRDTDPVGYRAALRRAGKVAQMTEDPASLARLEASRELEARIEELAALHDGLSALEQKKQRVELEKLAGELFDLRQEQRREHLAELEARLQELEEDIESRDDRREAIIDKWVDERLGDADPGL